MERASRGRKAQILTDPPNRCRELRMAAGLTLRQLAELLSISPATLHDYETTGLGLGKAKIYLASELLHTDFTTLDKKPEKNLTKS